MVNYDHACWKHTKHLSFPKHPKSAIMRVVFSVAVIHLTFSSISPRTELNRSLTFLMYISSLFRRAKACFDSWRKSYSSFLSKRNVNKRGKYIVNHQVYFQVIHNHYFTHSAARQIPLFMVRSTFILFHLDSWLKRLFFDMDLSVARISLEEILAHILRAALENKT